MNKDRFSVSISISFPTFYPLQTSSKDIEKRLKTTDGNQILIQEGLQPYPWAVIVSNLGLEPCEGRCSSLIKTMDPTRVLPI